MFLVVQSIEWRSRKVTWASTRLNCIWSSPVPIDWARWVVVKTIIGRHIHMIRMHSKVCYSTVMSMRIRYLLDSVWVKVTRTNQQRDRYLRPWKSQFGIACDYLGRSSLRLTWGETCEILTVFTRYRASHRPQPLNMSGKEWMKKKIVIMP